MNFNFLFGAGVSFAFKLPGTTQITNSIVSSSSGYIKEFLNILGEEIKEFYRDDYNNHLDYETLYCLSSQIHDYESSDPVVSAFVQKISKKFNTSLKTKRLIDTTRETCEYITNKVVEMLSEIPDDILKFKLIHEIIDSKSTLNIYTLNHDLILEKLFDSINVKYSDGFSLQNKYKMRYWNPSSYFVEEALVRIFKLHGSINWYRYIPTDLSWYDEIAISECPNCAVDRNGKPYDPPPDHPEILIGTFNKIVRYTRGIHFRMLSIFREEVEKVDNLIISGHSFRDKGINALLIDWLFNNRDRQAIIIDPNPSQLKLKARGEIKNKWDNMVKEKIFLVLEKGIEQISLKDVNSFFI